MSRETEIKCKLCRREGRKLFLKAARCYSPKCPIERKGAVPPGMHGQKRKSKLSDYGKQLREKQKVKRMYWITEKQMKNYFTKAKNEVIKSRTKKIGQKIGTGEYILQLLELRLDNVLFRSGFSPSRLVARQIITHGHILVNGKKVSIPSYKLTLNQVISLDAKALEMPIIKANIEKKIVPSSWLAKKAAVVKIVRFPERKEIDADIDEQLIVEFYSR